ncbi:MAG: hypothetical protein IJJ72_07965 [Bacteroidales bacterium]|nr:hypothetical protein [Bacteroidales bacterium]
MIRFTIFRLSNHQPVLHMDFARRQKEIDLFASLINGDANNREIKRVQVMTEALKERLKLLDVVGDKSYRAKHFLEEIPNGQMFLIVAGHIEDELEYHIYLTQLAKINGVTPEPSTMDRIGSYLWEHYEVRIYKGDDRRRIGVDDKSLRVCRFCGKKMPEVSFKHKAHAISEALGNKGLVCLEECDECNKRFNESIEQDLVQMMLPHLLLHGISGKNGIPVIKGDGFTMKLDTSTRATLGLDTIKYILRDMPNNKDPQNILAGINKDYEPFLQYKPQNIYKCFCKYALSLMDSSELKCFQDTIAWINEPITKHRLPPIWHYSVNTEGKTWKQTTSMIIMRRKHVGKDLPYCWAIMIIAGEPYIFIIPFCSQDKYKFVGKMRQDFFMNGIKNMMQNVPFQPRDMSGITPVKTRIRLSFEISPDCEEGRDYYILEPEMQK